MIKKQSIEGALATVVEDAVEKFEGDDTANAMAYVVQETDTEEREKILQAVASELSTDDLSRLEKRELFLIQRARKKEQLRRRLGSRGAGLLIATGKY